jgi:hypothetical protein
MRLIRFFTPLAIAGAIGAASLIAAPIASASTCGGSFWDQSYTNCRPTAYKINVTYGMGGGPHGDMLYTTVPYCVQPGQTKAYARPDLGMGSAFEIGPC